MKQCPKELCLDSGSFYIDAWNYCPVCGIGLIAAPVCPGCARTLSNPRTPFCPGCGAEIGF